MGLVFRDSIIFDFAYFLIEMEVDFLVDDGVGIVCLLSWLYASAFLGLVVT